MKKVKVSEATGAVLNWFDTEKPREPTLKQWKRRVLAAHPSAGRGGAADLRVDAQRRRQLLGHRVWAVVAI